MAGIRLLVQFQCFLLLLLPSLSQCYRIAGETDSIPFSWWEQGFVGTLEEPSTSHQPDRVNEGAPSTTDYSRLWDWDLPPPRRRKPTFPSLNFLSTPPNVPLISQSLCVCPSYTVQN